MVTDATIFTAPFILGRQYWLPRLSPQQITVPCPVCYGAKAVVVTLGNGDQVTVECAGCGLGYEGPRGYVHSYTYDAHAAPFTIKSVDSMHGGDWWLRSAEGGTAPWADLRDTQEVALAESRERMQQVVDDNTRRAAASGKRAIKQATWSVRYHEMCIADLDQKLQWHRAKVSGRTRS